MTRPEAVAGVGDADLDGTTAFVTGATHGVGRETALALGRLGARVLVHGRDRTAGRALANELRELDAEPVFVRADFADPDAPGELADAVAERVDELDVLVNNAGAHFDGPSLVDGVERTFRVNHLAPFELTRELLPDLSSGGRVVTVASAIHERATAADLEIDAVTDVDDYDGFRAYARSKLANVLFSRELAARHPDKLVNCLHPGFVPGSELWREASLPVSVLMRGLSVLPAFVLERIVDTPRTAAATSVYLAAADDYDVTGEYFSNCSPKMPSEAARDDALAAELWARTESLVADPPTVPAED
ncbi:SDR family NAD(P)-dependent oxidoreductase [Halorubellus sp. JP-L1]|uniref:SDR family NAD(P)-dependent oxidoreductase n=1 Tax=Halorubellus sp. JP-L1 TaxID=2715753 RepID=UPI0014083A15|nr:SDR family NAD(P)-dependent oxidoreductase [Halorubellus sp. JP-L1]NHN42683.1 SDR family NAD(P)-dependent oxidoreductase [Halorubellus sp. JP-L1]